MTTSPVILNGKSITLNGTTITVDNSGQLVIDGAKISSNNLFDFKYSDYLLNDPNWVNADANNWCSSTDYPNAYEHLTDDLDGITSETETIGSYTITFYRATDGHKICLADQETTIANIFTETGVAWYYLVDTQNTRFKLPRELPFDGQAKGNGMTLGMTNGTVNGGMVQIKGNYSGLNTKAAAYGEELPLTDTGTILFSQNDGVGITTDSTKSGIILNRTSSKYLNFYVN